MPPETPTFTVGRHAKVLESNVEGNSDLGDFSCLNRSTLGLGAGVGVSTYISDAIIGRYSMIGSRVSIGGFEHPTNWLSAAAFQWGQSIENWDIDEESRNLLGLNIKPKPIPTKIEADVWIGNNVVVLAGVNVGVGSVVGAGSVVTKDVGEYEVVVGNPARVIRKRFSPDIVEALLETKWWELPMAYLARLPFQNIKETLRMLREIQS